MKSSNWWGRRVTFPSNSSWWCNSLFGVRTDICSLVIEVADGGLYTEEIHIQVYQGVAPNSLPLIWMHPIMKKTATSSCPIIFGASMTMMSKLPNLTTGITINRVGMGNHKTGTTTNTRNIIALTDLENTKVFNRIYGATGQPGFHTVQPIRNIRDGEYRSGSARHRSEPIPYLSVSVDYRRFGHENWECPSAYIIRIYRQYIIGIYLWNHLADRSVLAIAYEYTYGGVTYQVGDLPLIIRIQKRPCLSNRWKHE